VPVTSLLIANRGEIAIRIARAAADLGIRAVAVFSEDDAGALHVRRADAAYALRGVGPAAYLDGAQLVDAARAAGCDAIHPGYGFLAERADFARRCREAGLAFVGPRPEVLALLGDKTRARALAAEHGVPVLAGTGGPASVDDARRLLAAHGAVVLKAVAGGGGRGVRIVREAAALDDAWARCRSEARAAFGVDDVYAEELVPHARHVEVQVLGDGSGAAVHLGERECTLQRRHQKLLEVAPSPFLSGALRARITAAAVGLAGAVRYEGAGTFEFLVDAVEGGRFAFIEVNPRLQVEHIVTEMVTGIDLVQAQLRLAGGATLAALGLARPPAIRGVAVQVRVNAETPGPDGTPRPASGRSPSSSRRPGPASASTPPRTPARRRIRASTRFSRR